MISSHLVIAESVGRAKDVLQNFSREHQIDSVQSLASYIQDNGDIPEEKTIFEAIDSGISLIVAGT